MKTNKNQCRAVTPDVHKVVMIRALFVLAIAITLSGIAFTLYSVFVQQTFRVLNAPLPGFLFGVLVIYFGVRSLLSVRKLREEVYKRNAHFSWNNFKKKASH